MEEFQIEDLIDDFEQYQGYGVFVVLVSVCWKFLVENIKGKLVVGGELVKNIGQLIDEVMDVVMKVNLIFGGMLLRLYNKDNIDQCWFGELIDLFNSVCFSWQGEYCVWDLMGEVYEYFFGNFVCVEGKWGGEFFILFSVVKVIVEVLELLSGWVYDLCCGFGGMFVQIEKFIYEYDGDLKDVLIYGQESIEEIWWMVKMNFVIYGIDNKGFGV